MDVASSSGSTVDLVVVEDAERAARAAATFLVEAAAADGSVVLAGGSTPRRGYELAAEHHPDWGGAEVWFGDERCVPPSDPRSNQLLVKESLLDRLVVPPLVHPVQTGLGPEAAAAAYEEELRGSPLDVVLLGIGPDGHTASLFPGSPALHERERLVVAAAPGLEPFVERITMTIPALESAVHVVFLIVGGGKAEAVQRAFGEPPCAETPSSLVRSRGGRTTVILDEAAASRLR